ncbi:MAG: sulfate ABC transporter substrate-binding protein [Actinobacteria bacterium]|nr:MAG: sulfate ABC transporter substrate-binding protein [Actinomycetota bacterium]
MTSDPIRRPSWRRLTSLLALALTLVLLAAGCGDSKNKTAAKSTGTTAAGSAAKALPAAQLTLVAYSTPQEAYDKLTEAFRQTPQGKNITFTKSFGASGDQSRAVESGLTADVVAFALEPDITRLVKANLVAADWNSGPEKGMITDSVVAFVTRKGNPKHIKTWSDLTKPGVEVITPNPFTSGGARWNVMAGWGAQLKQGRSEADAKAYLEALFRNVPVQDDSARKALQTFTSGKGDVMLAYENEAIFAQLKGQAIDYTIPDQTILIENPIAVTSNSKYPEQAKAFIEYLRTPAAQAIFAENGYRPTTQGVTKARKFETPKTLFTIADVGGWADVSKKFFDPTTGIVAGIERGLGVSIDKK